MDGAPARPRIIVGVDGSAASLAALRWALGEARAQHLDLVAVRAYLAIGDPYQGVLGLAPAVVDRQEQARTRAELRESVRQALGEPASREVGLEVHAGPAAAVLARLADGAALLVIGRARPQQWVRLQVCTADRVLRHARCPVVVVPAARAVTRSVGVGA